MRGKSTLSGTSTFLAVDVPLPASLPALSGETRIGYAARAGSGDRMEPSLGADEDDHLSQRRPLCRRWKCRPGGGDDHFGAGPSVAWATTGVSCILWRATQSPLPAPGNAACGPTPPFRALCREPVSEYRDLRPRYPSGVAAAATRRVPPRPGSRSISRCGRPCRSRHPAAARRRSWRCRGGCRTGFGPARGHSRGEGYRPTRLYPPCPRRARLGP